MLKYDENFSTLFFQTHDMYTESFFQSVFVHLVHVCFMKLAAVFCGKAFPTNSIRFIGILFIFEHCSTNELFFFFLQFSQI